MRAGPSCIAGSFTGRDEEGVPDELRYKSRKTLRECRSLKRWLQSLGGQDQKLDSILVGPGRNNAHSLKGEGGKAPTFCWFQPGWGIPGERQWRKSCFRSSHQPGIFSQGPSKMGPLWTPPSPFLFLFGEPASLRTQDYPSCPDRGPGYPPHSPTHHPILILSLGILLPPRLTSLKEQGGSLIIWALHTHTLCK